MLQDLVLQLMQNSSGSDNVAHIAHLSGTAFGFCVCMSMLAVQLLPRDQFDVLALLQRWNKRRQYQVLVRNGYDPFAYVPPQRAVVNPNADRIHDFKAGIGEALDRA